MKRVLFVILSAAFVWGSLCCDLHAQNRPKNNPREQYLIFWGYPDNYIENQARMAFGTIDEMLLAYPPRKEMTLPRRMALVGLDQLLHDQRNDKSEPFYTFINMRMQRMLEDLRQPVKTGIKIYKLYNDGFIMKTKHATVAVDLVQGGPSTRPFIADSIIYAIAGQCDAMFISHSHGDHANLNIAKAFAARGKRVVVPKDLWVGVDPMIQQLLVADSSVTISFDELKMTLHILPGHQDDMYNNIYVMDFKGCGVVAHTGDQYNEDDLEWIDRVHEQHQIDVLLLNCWVNSMERTIRGFNPKVLITGHENEMEHSIDHRESYWMTMKKMERMPTLKVPNVLMTWGEWFVYKK